MDHLKDKLFNYVFYITELIKIVLCIYINFGKHQGFKPVKNGFILTGFMGKF